MSAPRSRVVAVERVAGRSRPAPALRPAGRRGGWATCSAVLSGTGGRGSPGVRRGGRRPCGASRTTGSAIGRRRRLRRGHPGLGGLRLCCRERRPGLRRLSAVLRRLQPRRAAGRARPLLRRRRDRSCLARSCAQPTEGSDDRARLCAPRASSGANAPATSSTTPTPISAPPMRVAQPVGVQRGPAERHQQHVRDRRRSAPTDGGRG